MKQGKQSVQTCLKTTAIMEANPASPTGVEANQKNSRDDLFAEIVKMSTTLNKVACDVLIIKVGTTELKNTVSALQTRLEEAETRIANVEDRKNIRLIGLKEAGNTMNDYVKRLLGDGLGLQGDEYGIERSHRSGGPTSGDYQPPRMILVRFLHYTAQQKVLAAAKK